MTPVNPRRVNGMNRLQVPELKRAYNRELFSVVAPAYALVTRVLSFFRDATWKKRLICMLPRAGRNDVVLDIACGSGDITVLIAREYPDARIIGCDLVIDMMRLAAYRLRPAANTALSLQDMALLGIKDGSIALVTGGYALRNAPDLTAALHETARVLKTGGLAAFLDFSKSRIPFIAFLQCAVLSLWGGLWGLLLHRKPSVYAYIGRSLAVYPDRKRLQALFEEAGFIIHSSLLRMFGFVQILVVQKK
jgi:demethylmenaquinone methyltransferase/2-methoxy-6-polyprenyl-1,4-benzoquinol methylase